MRLPIQKVLLRLTGQRGTAAFMVAAVIVGFLAGLGAALVVLGIEFVGGGVEALRDTMTNSWMFVAVPAGIFVSWLIARQVGPEVEGGGVTETMLGLSVHGGYLSTKLVPAKIAATAATLGAGGSAGREGPMILIGGAIGSAFARHTRFGEDQIRSLVAAGAGAGLGASFNAPIAGMLFAMEVILGNFAIRHLNAVVVASVAAAVTTRSIVGEEQILRAPPHSLDDPTQLVAYLVLALVTVAFGLWFIRVTDRVSDLKDAWQRRYPDWLRPVVGGLLVAAMGLFEPDLLGTGQTLVADVVRSAGGIPAWWILVLLAGAKPIATALTRSSGGSGGTFMPSLFIGAVLGAAVAEVLNPVWPFTDLDVGAFAVVGMAALISTTARAPLTSIIFVFEITGDYGLVLPLMLATSVATFIADRVHPDSIYLLPLRRRGIHLVRTGDIDLLDTVTVGEVMTTGIGTLSPGMTLLEAERVLDREHHHGLPVVEDGRLVGVLTLSDIAKAGGPRDDVTVAEAMTKKPITVTPSMPVSAALARMAALGVGRLPVVADDDPTRLVGMFRRESVVRAYHVALGATTDKELYRERLRIRTHPGATFFELPVLPGSKVVGKAVRELPWPENAILVSVRRGGSVLIPHGDTVLREGDVITAFGTSDARLELAYLLEPAPEPVETPTDQN